MATATGTAVTRATRSTLPSTVALDRALERSIELATERNIEVVGRGHRLSDHAPIYATTSGTDAQRWHIVAVEGKRHLRCDCAASMHGQPACSHKGAVYMWLVVHAARTDYAARRVGAALAASAYGPPSPDAPQLADDTRGFSLYK